MIHKKFAEITLGDIIKLQTDGIEEGKTIDYKLQLHLKDKSARKEFARDVTSFANTEGGDLIIGVSEEKGAITEILGIEVSDKDALRLDIENLLRTSIEPQLPNVEIDFYSIEERFVLHIHVSKSYNGPHIVNGTKFVARNSGGKYELDYTEIKQRFTSSKGIENEMESYHFERLMKIKRDDGYWETGDGAAIVMHIMPIQSFIDSYFVTDLKHEVFSLNPLFRHGYDPKINFNGIAGVMPKMYHHINRQGITEIVDKSYLNRHIVHGIDVGPIEGPLIISQAEKALNQALRNAELLGFNGPYYIFTTILDIKGRVFVMDRHDGSAGEVHRENDMIFPKIIVSNPQDISEYTNTLKILFANASGEFLRDNV
ncbi:TPA: AlbA family DNA-binding domain-containing protein [Bacillus cereus]